MVGDGDVSLSINFGSTVSVIYVIPIRIINIALDSTFCMLIIASRGQSCYVSIARSTLDYRPSGGVEVIHP